MEQANTAYSNQNTYDISETLNGIVFNSKSININQKLNTFLHSQLKSSVGVRDYLYNLQNIIFTAMDKNTLGVICENKDNGEKINDRYNTRIYGLVQETWKNTKIKIKYFYIQDGRAKEIVQETNFVEKPSSKVIYFNERANNN